jgi:ornithine carbamoyltransferase
MAACSAIYDVAENRLHVQKAVGVKWELVEETTAAAK